MYELPGDNWFATIQAMTTRGNDVYWYVYDKGIYHLKADGKEPQLIVSKGEIPTAHYEEAYDSMNIDPTGNFVVLYGWKENAVVIDILNGYKPISAFNDYVRDAYQIDGKLWAGGIDNKVVINTRKGKSMNNQDFINYGSNDQTGMTKIYVSSSSGLPNMGEQDVHVSAPGEMKRLIYNKGNGDLLMCVSENGGPTTIFKINDGEPVVVAQVKNGFDDFAAMNEKIFARSGYQYAEIPYGAKLTTELNPQAIKTDLMKPKTWEGQKPEVFEVSGNKFMDYDKDGNLWLVGGSWGNKDLFVIFK